MAPKNMKIVCGDGHQNMRGWLLLRPVFFKNSAVSHYNIHLDCLIDKNFDDRGILQDFWSYK